ncbi:MAG: GAF domain-containing protein [Chloroflexota bacterium]
MPENDEIFRLHAELQERHRQASVLNRVMMAGASHLEVEAILESMCRELAQALELPQAAAALLEEDGDNLRVVAEYLEPGRPSGMGAVMPLQGNPAGQYVLEKGIPLACEDAQNDPRMAAIHDLMRQRGTVSMLIVPLAARGQIIGTLGLDAVQPRRFSQEEINLATNVATAAAQVLENARLLAETRRQAQQTEALLATSRAISTLELHAVLETIASQARQLFAADGARIHLLEADGETLRCVVAQHLRAEEVMKLTLRKGEGFTGRVAASGQAEMVNNSLGSPGGVQVPGTPEEDEALALAPLKHHHSLTGVMTVSRLGSQRPFHSEDLRLLEAFAEQAALAIENARLFEVERRRSAELEAVNHLSVTLRSAHNLDEMLALLLDETLAVLDCQAGTITLYEAQEDLLRPRVARGWPRNLLEVPLKPGEGITGQSFARREAIVSTEFAADGRLSAKGRPVVPAGWSGACVPICTSQEAVGVLFVSARLPRQISATDLHLLTTLCEIAGNAIQRMRLHEQTERRVQQLSALRVIDLAITSSFDLRVTLSVVLDQVVNHLKVDAADVLLVDPHSRMLDFAAGRGFRSDELRQVRLMLGEGLPGRVAMERRPLHSQNLASEAVSTQRRALLSEEGFLAYTGLPLTARGQLKGVLEVFLRRREEIEPDSLRFLEMIAGQAAMAIDNARLFEDLQRSNLDLTLAYDRALEAWGQAVEVHNRDEAGHTRRVTELTLQVARALGVKNEEMVHMRRGALLHDVGMLAVAEAVLHKEAALSETERLALHAHPKWAQEMLGRLTFLQPALAIPVHHHERWDGSGYPQGLKGTQIPLAARIFAAAEAWTVLGEGRAYRPAWPEEQIRKYMREQAGERYDPGVVEALFKVVEGEGAR